MTHTSPVFLAAYSKTKIVLLSIENSANGPLVQQMATFQDEMCFAEFAAATW